MNRIQLIFNEKWAMAREDYYNLVSLILPSIHSGNFKEVEAFFEKDMKHFKIGMLFYMTILTFIIGAICGNFTLKWLGQYSLCISGVLLIIVCIIIIFDMTYKRKDKEEKIKLIGL